MKDGLLKKCLRIVVIQVKITIFVNLIDKKAWIGKGDDWDDFARRLSHQLDLYDLWGIRYNDVVEQTLIPPRQR